MSPVESIVLSLNIASWFLYFLLMMFVFFAVRRAWITLGSTQYIVESFQVQIHARLCLRCPFWCFKTHMNICEKKRACELFDRLTGRMVDCQTGGCYWLIVYEWVGGKHAQVDLNEVSPLAGLKAKTFIVG
jgi:hypothetical protein